MSVAYSRSVPSVLNSTAPAAGKYGDLFAPWEKGQAMESQNSANASRLKTVLSLLVTILSSILFVAAVTILVSLPDASTANSRDELLPVVDTYLFVTAVVIPFTFVIVLATRARRHR